MINGLYIIIIFELIDQFKYIRGLFFSHLSNRLSYPLELSTQHRDTLLLQNPLHPAEVLERSMNNSYIFPFLIIFHIQILQSEIDQLQFQIIQIHIPRLKSED